MPKTDHFTSFVESKFIRWARSPSPINQALREHGHCKSEKNNLPLMILSSQEEEKQANESLKLGGRTLDWWIDWGFKARHKRETEQRPISETEQ